MISFLLDANLPLSAVGAFSPHGQVTHARDIGLAEAPDAKVFDAAVTRGSILVTRDLEFGNPNLFDLKRVPGLVIIRVPSFFTAAQIAKIFREFLSAYPAEHLAGYITVVEIGRVRQRTLG